MTQEIHYRSVVPEDYPALHQLNRNAWFRTDYSNHPVATDAYTDINLNDSLNDASFGMVAEVDGQIAGVILASSDFDQKHLRMVMTNPLKPVLTLNDQTEEVQEYFFDMMRQESENDQYLLAEASKTVDYQGRIVLFIMDPDYQGRGIGSQLFKAVNRYFEDQGVERFYLFTDTSCNYPFYDHKGLRRAQSKTLAEASLFEAHDGQESDEPFSFFLYDNQ